MRDTDAVEQALDACFDAIFAPGQWTSAMDSLARSLGALGCCLNPNNRPQADRMRLPASSRYRDMLGEFVAGDWKAQDLRHLRGWKMAMAGKPMVFESDCCTPEERAKLPIYAELFTPHDLEIFVGIAVQSSGEQWSFNLVRAERMGGFEHDDPRDMLRVRPALARMLKIANQLGVARAQSAMAAFEQSGLGAVLLNAEARVVHLNAAAARVMGQGIDMRHGRLAAESAADDNRLQGLIRSAVSGGMAADAPPAFLHRDGKPPLIVEAVEIHRTRGEILGLEGAMLLITDPHRSKKPGLEMLRQAFSLTAQEARVARLMSSGVDAAEIGEILQLRRSSVQQLVKNILSKTGTHRQGALVALLSRFPNESAP